MAYGHLMGFMYDVGNGVGEFSCEEEKGVPESLANIVHAYVQAYYWLDIFLLRKQIKHYLAAYASEGAVDYYDPPFNQELCFVEYHFQCELFEFLNQVLKLIDKEINKKRNGFMDALIGVIFGFFIRK